MRRIAFAAPLALALIAGLALAASKTKTPAHMDETFRARMETIATLHPSVDSGLQIRPLCWAAYACGIPPRHTHSSVVGSTEQAKDAAHGRKLYTLWTTHPQSMHAEKVPSGAIVVKRSFHPKAVASPSPSPPPLAISSHGCHYADVAALDGTVYEKGENAGLFVMQKLDESVPGTDHGWIYGTIAPDGKVLSSGALAECVSCHHTAAHDHLFVPAEAFAQVNPRR